MQLNELVGHLAIRRCQTQYGKMDYISEPVFILSCNETTALACMLEDSEFHAAGVNFTLSGDFMDDNWIDFGTLLSRAAQTKTQVISQILRILGIEADEASLYKLCKAVSYKQIFSEIEEQLGLSPILNAMQSVELCDDTVVNAAASTINARSTWNSIIGHQNPVSNPNTVPNNAGYQQRGRVENPQAPVRPIGNFVRRNN